MSLDFFSVQSYSVDARNHGDSEWNDYFNFDVNVDDLLHFMDVLGIRKAILVGHSMGGKTAIKTALKRVCLVSIYEYLSFIDVITKFLKWQYRININPIFLFHIKCPL